MRDWRQVTVTSNSKENEYFHDCPALGKNTKTIRAMKMDGNNEYVLYFSHKCPFCSAESGEREYSDGVTENEDGSFSYKFQIFHRHE